jgi:hypothetical protein
VHHATAALIPVSEGKPSAMKKFFTAAAVSFSCVLSFVLQGCLKDSYEKTFTYSYYQPVYKTLEEVKANIKGSPPQNVERPGKICILGKYIFLNEVDKGIHVIDNSDPWHPQRVSFIDIPGNLDIAVKGNTLYADMYTDFVAIDISNPRSVQLKKLVEDVFPYRNFGNYFRVEVNRIIVGWEKRDTTIREKHKVDEWLQSGRVFFALSSDQSLGMSGTGKASSSAPYGVGGSMARFAITRERLYAVGDSRLDVFNISRADDPMKVSNSTIGSGVETIYPFRGKLFIGSQTGMFVYNINNPDNPVKEGTFTHVRTCDPVIADDKYAYVTLRSGTTCQGFTNQLDILDLSNFSNPSLVKSYPLTNPHGLSKDGNILFVCDGKNGLSVFDATNASDLKFINRIPEIETFDVIAFNANALVVAKDGLYQYDYSDLNNIKLKSKIEISKP